MKLEKKHWIIIGIVVAIILVWYFFLRKKKAESGYQEEDVVDSSYKAMLPPTRIKSKCQTCVEKFSMDLKGASSTSQTPGLTTFNQAMFQNAMNKLIECSKS